MKKLVQLKNKENEKLDPINKNYEQRIEKIENDISFFKGTVLYNNTNGSMGNISLNDSIENYKYIDILFKDDQNIYNTARFIVKNGAWYSLQSFQYVKADSRIVVRGKNIQLIDKTINSTMPNPLKISRFTLMFLGIKYIIFYQHPIYY